MHLFILYASSLLQPIYHLSWWSSPKLFHVKISSSDQGGFFFVKIQFLKTSHKIGPKPVPPGTYFIDPFSHLFSFNTTFLIFLSRLLECSPHHIFFYFSLDKLFCFPNHWVLFWKTENTLNEKKKVLLACLFLVRMKNTAHSNVLFCRATAALDSLTFVLSDWLQGSPKRLVSAWAHGSTQAAVVLLSAQHSPVGV